MNPLIVYDGCLITITGEHWLLVAHDIQQVATTAGGHKAFMQCYGCRNLRVQVLARTRALQVSMNTSRPCRAWKRVPSSSPPPPPAARKCTAWLTIGLLGQPQVSA